MRALLAIPFLLVLPAGGLVGQDPGQAVPDRVLVKLAEGCGAVLGEDGVLRSRNGVDVGAAAELFARAEAERLVKAPLEVLDAWHARAWEVLPADRPRPGHLGLWFRLTCSSRSAATALLEDLQVCPLLEHAYREPVFVPTGTQGQGCSDPPPPTPLFTAQQLYLDPAPTGVGSRFAQGILGGRGRGVGLVIVEEEWRFDHEDLSKVNTQAVIGNPPSGGLNRVAHGTAGGGILVADHNCFGVDGMVDRVDLGLIAWPDNAGLPNSLVMGALAIQPGDVMMMVQGRLLGQVGPDDFVPVEYMQAEFDTLQTVTANGRIVVESAANGTRSLDDPRHLRKFDLGFRDSGALMIAATDGGNLVRAWFSNYGSRIDANGWGEFVVTTGFGNLFTGNGDPRQRYTNAYAGTSAATPIVTGAVASLVGAARWQLERQLTNLEIRSLLRTYGSSVPGNMSNRPDLRQLFTVLGILDGLEMSAPGVSIGGSVDVLLDGPSGGGALLFAAIDTARVDVGLNRKVHLALSSLTGLGVFFLPGGTARFTFNVPNSIAFQGFDVYFQALSFDAQGGSPHITNSGQVTIF